MYSQDLTVRPSRRKYERHPKQNLKLRAYIASQGVAYGEIADYIHIGRTTLSQWMSYELSKEKELEITQAVKAICLLRGRDESEKVPRV